MSEIQYGQIPTLGKQLAEANKTEDKHMKLLRNKATDAEIAEILARWTGIPVSRMLEREREKLLRMEQELHRRVIGQDEAGKMQSLTQFVVAVLDYPRSKSPNWFVLILRTNRGW